jgi:hypothetical protein
MSLSTRAPRIVGALIAALILLMLPATAAHASARADQPVLLHAKLMQPVPPAAGKTAAAAADSCPVTEYGYTGQRLCAYGWTYLDRGNGNLEYFVIGTNYAVYHIWKGASGWKSLGGQTSRTIVYGAVAYAYTDGSGSGVSTYGTNNLQYCRDWPWTADWYRCEFV